MDYATTSNSKYYDDDDDAVLKWSKKEFSYVSAVLISRNAS